MSPFEVDILVPVWNRPVETRNCLVTLIDGSPGARFILLDNGSDRETERLLEEFAEILGERALLLKTNANLGLVRALNRGLQKAEAPFVAIVRNTTIVYGGWLTPLLDLSSIRPDAGIMVPHQELSGRRDGRVRDAGGVPSVVEVSHGSFAAMLIRREVVDRQGGFDEGLDGGLWCLKDYSRRAFSNGFLTFAVGGTASVKFSEEVPLGSPSRREEVARRSAEICEKRWGREDSFCVYFPKDMDLETVRGKLEIILQGARMGLSFTVILHRGHYRGLSETGQIALHRNIRIETLPRLFPSSGIPRIIAGLRSVRRDTVTVSGVDGLSVPGVNGSIPFSRLADDIIRRKDSLYRCE